MMRKRMLVRWLSIHICAEIDEFRPDKVTTFMQHFYLRVILYTHTSLTLHLSLCKWAEFITALRHRRWQEEGERREDFFPCCVVLSVNQFLPSWNIVKDLCGVNQSSTLNDSLITSLLRWVRNVATTTLHESGHMQMMCLVSNELH